MPKDFKLIIGDLVIRHGKILKVSQISKDSVDLQPYFNCAESHGLTYSVQLPKEDNDKMRKPVASGKIKQLLALILKKRAKETNINIIETRSALNTSKLAETLKIIKSLWQEKQGKSGFLAAGKLGLYRQAMLQATEEIAAAKGILPKQAELLVLSSLGCDQKYEKKN